MYSSVQSAEFVVEPASVWEIIIRVFLSCAVPGFLLAVIIAVVNGFLLWPLQVFGVFSLMGILRVSFWVWRYRGHGFVLNESGVALKTIRKKWEIPLEEISGIRYRVPSKLPEGGHNGFAYIEIELVDGKRMLHAPAVFKRACEEKCAELEEVAPALGFHKVETPRHRAGFWCK